MGLGKSSNDMGLTRHFLFLLPLHKNTNGGSSQRLYGVMHVQGKREKEHALGLGHAMKDEGYHVGPTRMRSKREIWVSNQIWGLE